MGGQKIGDFIVSAHSISGNETSVAVKTPTTTFLFDVGIALGWSVRADNVFIRYNTLRPFYIYVSSHGHIDHIGSICQHMRKRELIHIQPATYYMPPHLIEPVTQLCRQYMTMQGAELECFKSPKLVPISPGPRIEVCFPVKIHSFSS